MSQQIPNFTTEMQSYYANTLGLPFTTKLNNNEVYMRRLFVFSDGEYQEIANNYGFTIDDPLLPSDTFKYFLYYKFITYVEIKSMSLGVTRESLTSEAGVDLSSSSEFYSALKNNVHDAARIINDYTPPTPKIKGAEINIANGPSKIHSMGKSSYNVNITLLFPNRDLYKNFMSKCHNKIKFYDECGGIYEGRILESPQPTRMLDRYKVTLTLTCTKKRNMEEDFKLPFTDITNTAVEYTINVNSKATNATGSIVFNAAGETCTINISNRLADYDTPEKAAYRMAIKINSDFGDKFSIIASRNKIILRPYTGLAIAYFQIDSNTTGMNVITSLVYSGSHWAKSKIEAAGQLGIIPIYDRVGNEIYSFGPDINTTRGEFAVYLNRLIKSIDEVVGR